VNATRNQRHRARESSHDYTSLRDISPVAIFELVFDNEMLNLIVRESTRYALFLNMTDPKVTVDEMKVFLAILILSGYSVVPGKRLYWESAGDVRNELLQCYET